VPIVWEEDSAKAAEPPVEDESSTLTAH